MSLISGLSRWTAMFRLWSSAALTASSSVIRSVGLEAAAWAAGAAGAWAVWPEATRSAACCTSSLMRASEICCALTGAAIAPVRTVPRIA